MTETPKKDSEVSAPQKPAKPLKKGSLIRVNRKTFLSSLESQASDPIPPEYIFKGPGEVLSIKGDYAQIRWRLPVPDSWLKVDQLEPFVEV